MIFLIFFLQILIEHCKQTVKVIYANSVDPDQTLHDAVSDLDLACLPMSSKKDARFIWVNPSSYLARAHLYFTEKEVNETAMGVTVMGTDFGVAVTEKEQRLESREKGPGSLTMVPLCCYTYLRFPDNSVSKT